MRYSFPYNDSSPPQNYWKLYFTFTLYFGPEKQSYSWETIHYEPVSSYNKPMCIHTWFILYQSSTAIKLNCHVLTK